VENLTEGVANVTEVAANLTEGVNNLTEGVDNLTEVVANLTEGVDTLSKGVDNLTKVVANLTEEVDNLTEGVDNFLPPWGSAFILTPTPTSHGRLGLNMCAHCPAVHSHSLYPLFGGPCGTSQFVISVLAQVKRL
jgi:prophage DNA circulation protein